MPSLKDLRTRIASTKNTQQTTRAMKMVSAAKLRRSQEAIVANRPYAKQIGKLIHLVSSMSGVDTASKLIRKESTGTTKPRLLLILVSSDRGLCGGFNSNIIKGGQRWIRENEAKYSSVSLGFIGRKAQEIFKNRGVKPAFYEEFGRKATAEKAREYTRFLINAYMEDQFDEIIFLYNEFKNAISQKVVAERFLPIQENEIEMGTTPSSDPTADLYLVKPGKQEILQKLLEKHFSIQLFRILLESQASEHGARMSAMENATKNAADMVRRLNLAYNKSRQASITKELLEIIAGSESQNN